MATTVPLRIYASTQQWRTQVKDRLGTGGAELTPAATDDFLWIPSMAGAPVGIPEDRVGLVPLVFDNVGGVLYVYTSGAWVAI